MMGCQTTSCANPDRRSRRRGLILFEIMVTLALLATFALVSTQLLRRSLSVAHDANLATGLTSTFDSALNQMRRDVWGAARLHTPDGKTLKIDRADGRRITWSAANPASLVRLVEVSKDSPDTEDLAPREWSGIATRATFAVENSVLMLIEPETSRAGARRVPLLNPIGIVREQRP
jgi:type II secretory pathway component PulJ